MLGVGLSTQGSLHWVVLLLSQPCLPLDDFSGLEFPCLFPILHQDAAAEVISVMRGCITLS